MTSRSLEGTDSQGGDGGKGPKSDLAITDRPRERLQGGRGRGGQVPEAEEMEAGGLCFWQLGLHRGCVGRVHRL